MSQIMHLADPPFYCGATIVKYSDSGASVCRADLDLRLAGRIDLDRHLHRLAAYLAVLYITLIARRHVDDQLDALPAAGTAHGAQDQRFTQGCNRDTCQGPEWKPSAAGSSALCQRARSCRRAAPSIQSSMASIHRR